MPSTLVDQHHGQALLDSIQYGSYPESEEVIAADLPSTAIPEILKLLKQAREDVKVHELLRRDREWADVHTSRSVSGRLAATARRTLTAGSHKRSNYGVMLIKLKTQHSKLLSRVKDGSVLASWHKMLPVRWASLWRRSISRTQ